MKTAKYLFGTILIVVLAATVIHAAASARAAPAGPASVIAWNAIKIRTIVNIGQSPAPVAFVYGAYVDAAVYNAVVAIEGGYKPYESDLASQPAASVDAAVATAAHDVLVKYFPGQQAALDNDYVTFMAVVPNNTAKTLGIELGSAAAAEVIAERMNDGLNADIGFTMPTPGPGVWQLPPGVNPLVPWLSKMKPFLLESPDQFRPGPPPDLSSREWATEYNEVKLYGRRDSTVRTPEQTDIARFWSSAPFAQYNIAYQQIANTRGLSALETARLMVMGNMVGADAEIGCFDAKYHYLFWRSVFAIPQGDTDGNPATVGDPTFVPLLPTPAQPDYPSSHSCLTASVAEVLAEFLGTQKIEVDIVSTVPGLAPRHFATSNDLTKEIIDARVWAGIHYRETDVKGANLGKKVAQWTLQRNFQPVP